MELRHCKYFVAVAEELNFRKAALRLHMEQPPLSRQIRQLERELGVELLQRDRRGVKLTQAGEIFLEQARLTVAQAEQAIKTVKQVVQSQPAVLTVGYSMCAFDRLLPKIVQSFRQSCPEVEIRLLELSSAAQVEALLAGEIDCGFLHLPIARGGLIAETLLKETVVAVLPKSHPLAGQEVISLRSLASESFIMCPQSVKPDWHRDIIKACQGAGFYPNIVQEVTSPNAIVSFVAEGAGISFLTSGYYTDRSADVVFIPLTEPTPILEIAIAWQRDRQPLALTNFIKTVRTLKPSQLA